MILMRCRTPRRSLKPSADLSLAEEETSTAPVAAGTVSSIKMEDANEPLEFVDDMAKYVLFYII